MDTYEDRFEAVEDVAGESMEKSFRQVRDELKSMPDMTLYFYIYKGQLAAVRVEGDKKMDEIEILFKGGDYRAQNISVEVDGDEKIALSGSRKNDKETYELEIEGKDVMSVEYNSKKGKLYIDYDYDHDKFELEMNVEMSTNEVKFSIDDFDADDEVSGSMSYTFKKGAKIQKFTNTEEFDVGNATKNDFMDLIQSFDLGTLSDFGRLLY